MTAATRESLNAEDALLQVEDLRVGFRAGRTGASPALKGVSFSIPINSTVALVGESGSGKTVSALAIVGLLPKDSAVVAADSRIVYQRQNLLTLPGEQLRRVRGKEISMIFQEPMTSLNPVLPVGLQIVEVLRFHLGMSRKQAMLRAAELLAEVGIPEPGRRIKAYPHELSGGQQQRVMIAIAIACEPKLLIADEPTTSLDVTIQKHILDLIANLQERHRMSVLFVTHDLAVVADIADRVVVMQSGEVRESGTARQIFESPRHPYTRALLACRPRLDAKPPRLPVIEDYMNGPSIGSAVDPPRPAAVHRHNGIVMEARNLAKDFKIREGLVGSRPFHAVRNVSFTLCRGQTLGLVGESGSGKTTLALMLLRLHEATQGEVLFEGRDILKLSAPAFMAYKRRIQIVFQNPYASLNPRFTIAETLTEPMQIHRIGSSARERQGLAAEMLARVGLPQSALGKYPHEFSGGQRQRIAIARCLTLQPEVLICDEAVSSLDVSIQAQVLNLLKDLQDEFGMSYLFVSHDLAVVKYISNQVMVMREGEIVETADADEIYLAPKHPYTRQLISSIPRGLTAGVKNL